MPLFTIVSPSGQQLGALVVASQAAASMSVQPGQSLVPGAPPSPAHIYVNGKWVLPA